MHASRFRLATVIVGAAVAALTLPAAQASAEVTSSQITSPSDPAYLPLFISPDDPGGLRDGGDQ